MKDVAKHLASKGRNGDTMLVHMSPEEVAGLQYLALASGGPLTVNPDTGLVEAFKLGKLFKSLLPTIAGAVLAPLTAGMVNPLTLSAMIGGATGLATGDWKKGLITGLGVYGGAGIGNAIANTGATELGKQAAASAAGDLSKTALTVPGSGALAPVTVDMALAAPSAGTFAATAAPQAAMKAGLQAINPMTATGRAALASTARNVGLKNAYMAATPAMTAMSTPAGIPAGTAAPVQHAMTTFNPGTVNPNFGKPGESYFVGRGYGPTTYTQQNPFQYAPAQNPPQYGTGYSGYGGMAAGGETSRFLSGPGDGVSDDIKARIYSSGGDTQEARLADGEYVLDARTVSEIGNGSSAAGAKKLRAMVNRIHSARKGAGVGQDSNADKYLPA